MQIMQSRRDFLASTSLAAAAGVLGARGSLADEGPPETTTIRLGHYPTSACAPVLHRRGPAARGRVHRHPLRAGPSAVDAVARGEIDFDLETAAWVVSHMDAGEPITALAGVHSGCYELFAHEPIRAISDLKGKRVGIASSSARAGTCYLTVMAAQVGLDPEKDIDWIASPDRQAPWSCSPKGRSMPSSVPARAAGAARPQDRSRDPQHWPRTSHGRSTSAASLFGNTGLRPRSSGRHQALPARHPQGRRLLRRRAGAGRATLVDAGFTERYDYALQTLTELPYASWREFDPEDSMRFYALRLHEVGMIKSSPNADHRRRHRLALPQRAQARAEGVSGPATLRPVRT